MPHIIPKEQDALWMQVTTILTNLTSLTIDPDHDCVRDRCLCSRRLPEGALQTDHPSSSKLCRKFKRVNEPCTIMRHQ